MLIEGILGFGGFNASAPPPPPALLISLTWVNVKINQLIPTALRALRTDEN